LPAAARLAMAFGSMSADLFVSASNRSPEPAALFYATDDDRAGEEAERLIRTAGFEPVKIGGIEQPGRLEVGGDPSRSHRRPRAGAVSDQEGLITSPA
jgi:8-hydroxy-5-deazaflavin:NADPH oxidoreductase